MKKRINNNKRKTEDERFKMYIDAAKTIGIELPFRLRNDPHAGVIFLSKQEPALWQSILKQAANLYPETFTYSEA